MPWLTQARTTTQTAAARADIAAAKLTDIVIPLLSFDHVPLNRVAETLSELSASYDKNGRGLNFVVKLPAGTSIPSTNLASFSYEVDNGDVALRPKNAAAPGK